MSTVSTIVKEHDIKWCASEDRFYIDSIPMRETAFIRYTHLNWNLSIEDLLLELKNTKRIFLSLPFSL